MSRWPLAGAAEHALKYSSSEPGSVRLTISSYFYDKFQVMTHKTRESLSIVELSQLSLSLLLAELAGLVRPGEVDHGDLEEGVAAVLETSQGVVPREERGKESKETCSLLESDLGSVVAEVVGIVLASEQEEADIEEEEEKEEGEGGLEGADEEEGSEDEPSSQEETHDGSSVALIRSISTEDIPGRSLKQTIGDPEATI